jgi:hypothetical protein
MRPAKAMCRGLPASPRELTIIGHADVLPVSFGPLIVSKRTPGQPMWGRDLTWAGFSLWLLVSTSTCLLVGAGKLASHGASGELLSPSLVVGTAPRRPLRSLKRPPLDTSSLCPQSAADVLPNTSCSLHQASCLSWMALGLASPLRTMASWGPQTTGPLCGLHSLRPLVWAESPALPLHQVPC